MRHIPTTGGLSLAVHELGGSGRPTLLCHATGFHGAVWEPLAAQLGDGLERWAVDFRAHGASTVPPGLPLDWHDFRDDVLSVLDALELPAGEVLGVGHSMGGAALLLAEQARPGTFAGLWLYEPIVPPGVGCRPAPTTRWPRPPSAGAPPSRPWRTRWPTTPRSHRSTGCAATPCTPTCATASSRGRTAPCTSPAGRRTRPRPTEARAATPPSTTSARCDARSSSQPGTKGSAPSCSRRLPPTPSRPGAWNRSTTSATSGPSRPLLESPPPSGGSRESVVIPPVVTPPA